MRNTYTVPSLFPVERSPLLRLFVIALVTLPPAAALAQVAAAVAAPSSTAVTFGDALAGIVVAISVPLAGLLADLIMKARAKLRLQTTAQDRANMEQEIQTVLAYGIAKAIPAIQAKGWDSVDVHSQVLADAMQFMLDRFPDRVRQIVDAASSTRDTPMDPARAVTQSLSARLSEAMAIAASSPATPPAPPAVASP